MVDGSSSMMVSWVKGYTGALYSQQSLSLEVCSAITDWKEVYEKIRLPVSVAEWWTPRPTAVWEDQGSNHTVVGCVYRDNCCDIQPWARAVHLYCSA